jgi:hypothetical protein
MSPWGVSRSLPAATVVINQKYPVMVHDLVGFDMMVFMFMQAWRLCRRASVQVCLVRQTGDPA